MVSYSRLHALGVSRCCLGEDSMRIDGIYPVPTAQLRAWQHPRRKWLETGTRSNARSLFSLEFKEDVTW